ncbi:MAG TPA: hypothetical protein QGH10_01125, partial [Armatimonadota bacterium]|nr:hypothetical protein [Armatimonadota bacterium]
MALPKGDPEKAFAQAIELQPSSPAPHMRYAVYHLVNAGKLGRAEAAGFEGVVPFRDTAQITHLRQAHDLLVTCRELDPDNAACDYWLAWTLFAQKRDTEAFTIIHEALSKDHWDDYHAEAVAAVFRVNDATNLPPMVSAIATSALLAGHDFPIHSSTRSLARLLVGLGDRFRSQDLDENAVLCYRACAQIGYVIRTDAKTTIEGLVGIAVSAIASTSFVTPGEREQVAAQFANTEERIAKVREAKLTRFTRYMNQQGESEFAAWYAADLDEGDLWKADASLAARGMVPWLIRSLTRGGILNGAAVGMNLVVMLSVAGLVWLASLVAAAWKEPKQTNLWSHATWAILLLVCLLPGQIAAFIAAGMIDADTESNMVVASVLTSITPVVGVVIWLVAVIVVALRRRESEPWESRLIKPRAVLSGLRAMILPTLAALLLAGLIATV